jgi:hypothetical protein
MSDGVSENRNQWRRLIGWRQRISNKAAAEERNIKGSQRSYLEKTLKAASAKCNRQVGISLKINVAAKAKEIEISVSKGGRRRRRRS